MLRVDSPMQGLQCFSVANLRQKLPALRAEVGDPEAFRVSPCRGQPCSLCMMNQASVLLHASNWMRWSAQLQGSALAARPLRPQHHDDSQNHCILPLPLPCLCQPINHLRPVSSHTLPQARRHTSGADRAALGRACTSSRTSGLARRARSACSRTQPWACGACCSSTIGGSWQMIGVSMWRSTTRGPSCRTPGTCSSTSCMCGPHLAHIACFAYGPAACMHRGLHVMLSLRCSHERLLSDRIPSCVPVMAGHCMLCCMQSVPSWSWGLCVVALQQDIGAAPGVTLVSLPVHESRMSRDCNNAGCTMMLLKEHHLTCRQSSQTCPILMAPPLPGRSSLTSLWTTYKSEGPSRLM